MKSKYKHLTIFLVLFISIGFAYLSTNLYISGRSIVKKTTWSIYFNNIQNEISTYQINNNATISTDKKSIDFEITFEKPGDSYSFNVDVVNNGNLDAMLESYNIVGLPNDASYLEWNVLYDDGVEFKKNDLLKAGTTDKLFVNVSFKEDVQLEELPTESDYQVNLKFIANYVQADNNGKERTSGIYNIRYNLDGGTISNNPTTYTIRSGAVIPNPTKEGYTFAGWTVGKNLLNISYLNDTAECNLYITRLDDGYLNIRGNINSNYVHLIPDTNITNLLANNEYYTLSQSSYNGKVYLQFAIKNKNNGEIKYLNATTDNYSVPLINTDYYEYSIQLQTTSKNAWGDSERNYTMRFQVEEGKVSTDWEPYISTPTKDIVLPKGSNGNRIYKANWIAN